MDGKRRRNFLVLLIVSALFGVAVGLYDFALPYYMKWKQISYQGMGYIFSISFLVIFFVQIWSARLSDKTGRKPFYSLSLFFSSLFNFLTPFCSRIFSLTIIKTLREASASIQETINAVILYENITRRFYIGVISKTSGLNFLFQGVGTFCAGFLLLEGYRYPFYISSGVLFLSFLILTLGFIEEERIEEEDTNDVEIMHAGWNRGLILLTISGFITNLGVALSHTQMMPLFFSVKYGVREDWVAILLALHRLSLGLPMIIAGHFVKRRLKLFYVLFLTLQNITISATAFMPTFLSAAGIWLVHDIIGGSVWAPVRSMLIQRFSREETRAYDVAKVTAIGNIGWVIGPIIAGYLANIDISLPFFMSGVISFFGVFPILMLDVKE